ncbi:hypothetical protein SAMN05421788_107276 [Filimonas lacunae]|uniref:Uncharacterized protein n=1 Tax=Filimonas lacunae TaxID=477680 RepID=A0A173MGI9_9BACT|nr:hypothetical protein FLA_2635 [Filimonas lacunae]SIT27595.1 hypothetical protein SAMN05421788_107276 [Filimonas lacunae]
MIREKSGKEPYSRVEMNVKQSHMAKFSVFGKIVTWHNKPF